MRLHLATVLATASLTLAAPALAEGHLSATLQADAGSAKFIAAHVLWTCAGASCTADNAMGDSDGLSGCEDFVRRAGAVTAYVGARALDEKKLAKCNTYAKPQTTQVSSLRAPG